MILQEDRNAIAITLIPNQSQSIQEQRTVAFLMEVLYDTDDVLRPTAKVRYRIPRQAAIDLKENISKILSL